jgi:thioredoxin 1
VGWLRKLFGIKDTVQPVTVNDENFETEVLRSELPVLLDVWTPTCVHCDRLVPVIVGLATRYQGRLKVAEVNGAESPRTMAGLNVRGTPTVIYFHHGKEVERVVGFRGSLYHQDFIENELLAELGPDDAGAPERSAPPDSDAHA